MKMVLYLYIGMVNSWIRTWLPTLKPKWHRSRAIH